VPTEPLSLTATPGNGTVYLTWLAPSDDGGAMIDEYVIRKAPTPAGPWEDVDYPSTSGYTALGLTNGTTYWFQLAAHNAAGNGPPSTILSAVPVGVPGATEKPDGDRRQHPGDAEMALPVERRREANRPL
jgi:hypothetical protein